MSRKTYYGFWILGLLLAFLVISSNPILAAQPNKELLPAAQPRLPVLASNLKITPPAPLMAPNQLPDLIIQSITLIPANPGAGGTADIRVVVKNQGDTATTKSFNLYLYVEPVDVPPVQGTPYTTFAAYALNLPAGGSFIYTRTGQVFNNTPPVVYAWVDPPWENKIIEVNEDNNLFPPTTGGPDAYEDDDDCANAKEIVPDGAIQDRNLYRHPGEDIDWIKFEGQGGVTYTAEAIAIGADASLSLGLYDRCEGFGSFGNGAKLEFTAPADGTYYMTVSSDVENYGPDNDYQFQVTSDSACNNVFEPNNTCSVSGDLELGALQTHTFCQASDWDWTRLPVTAGTKYKVTAANVGENADLSINMFMGCTEENSAASGPIIEFTAAEAGHVYFKTEQITPTIHGPGTEYTLKAELVTSPGCTEDDFEQDDIGADAKTLTTDGTLQRHNFCPAGDIDWVKFNAVKGITYNIETLNLASAADTVICLHTSSGDQLFCDDDGGAGHGSRLIFDPPMSGQYLLQIKDISPTVAGDLTAYDVRISQGLCKGDAFESDNNIDEATVISASNATTSHNFCPAGDQDWFGFFATGGTSYLIESLNPGPQADTVIELYNSSGALVALNDDFTPLTNSQIAFTPLTSGTYFVNVRQYNPSYYGAGTEYEVRIKVGTPVPTQTAIVTATPTPTPTPNPSSVRTLILVNRTRIEQLYSENEANQLMTKLELLAGHQQVRGEIIRLDNNAAVSAAYLAWTTDQSNIEKANQVTAAIRSIVITYMQQRAGLEYLVLVGDDRALPMRRILDRTPRFSEVAYKHVDANNPTGAALQGNYFLSDDYFSDREPTIGAGGELYIPDLATGRLIEAPAEMVGQIDAFLASPVTNVEKILVTGYDFVQDVAAEDCDDWGADFGPENVNCTLIGSTWTGAAFRTLQLSASPPFLIQSINGHATHYAEGAPQGNAIQAQEIADAAIDLSGGLIYSVGCHGGLNLPPNNPISPIDLAQAFTSKRANYVGNTGYGWGMRNSIGLSEKLIRLFVRAVLEGTKSSMGKALAEAKGLYYQQDQDFSAYDEKVMQQVIFYGLPMYDLESGGVLDGPGNDFPGVGFTPVLPGNPLDDWTVLTGSVSINFREAENLDFSETEDGTYFDLNGSTHVVPGQPIQPLHFGDITVPELPARGALLLGATFEAQGEFDPVIALPYNEYDFDAVEPDLPDSLGFYPPMLVSVQEFNGSSSLVTQLGQYDASIESLFILQEVELELYYSTVLDDSPPDTTVIDGVTPRGSGKVNIKVGAVDASGIERVVLSYIEDVNQAVRQLKSIDLSYDNVNQKWIGSFDGNTDSRYLVQVVDKAGNITTATNKGRYYQPGEVAEESGCTGRCVYLPVINR